MCDVRGKIRINKRMITYRPAKSNCGFVAFLQKGDKQAIVRMRCGSWACEKCVHGHLIENWLAHSASIIEKQGAIYRETCDPEKWDALRKAIKRKGGRYFRVLANDTFHVYSTAPIGEKLSTQEAIERMRDDSLGIRLGHRAFTSSQRWSLPKKQPTGWERIDIDGQQPQVAMEAIREAGRQHASELGVDDKTVGAVRGDLETIAEIPQCDRQTADGRTYPRKRKAALSVFAASARERSKATEAAST